LLNSGSPENLIAGFHPREQDAGPDQRQRPRVGLTVSLESARSAVPDHRSPL